MNKPLVARVSSTLGMVLVLSAMVTPLFGAPHYTVAKLVLGVAALAVGFTLSERGGLRRFLNGRAAYFGFFTGASAILLIAILGVANFIAYKKPKTWDLTKNKIFTLSEDTTRTLKNLKTDVKALAFLRQDEQGYAETQSLLRRYADKSSKFTFEFVDPYKSPELVKRYNITQGGPRLALLSGTAAADPNSSGGNKAMIKDVNEQGLTAGLLQVLRNGTKKLYFIQGHGEPDPRDESPKGYSTATKALEGEGFEVATLSLLETAQIPWDAAVVLEVSPRKNLLSPEVDALKTYLSEGGKLGLFLEPQQDSGLDSVLKLVGIQADADIVVDQNPVARLFGGSPVTPVIQQYTQHEITRNLTPIVLPTARSLVALTGDSSGWHATALALSGVSSWGETDIAGLFSAGRAQYDGGEKRGPMPVAMISIGKATAGATPGADAATSPAAPGAANANKRDEEGRAVVVGDGEFAGNSYQQLLGNMDFFLNSCNWLAAQEDRITIRPKSRESTRLFLTEAQVSALKFFTIDALPLTLLGLGLAVWLVRRSK